MRTSTGAVLAAPDRRHPPSCRTRSSFAWVMQAHVADLVEEQGAACADSNLPLRSASAPVNAPFTWPNISLSISSPGIAAQLSSMKARSRRGDRAWMRLRDQLLAGAALARDEHPALGGRGHLDELVDAPHGLRAADHAVAGARPQAVSRSVSPRAAAGCSDPVEDLEEAVLRDRLLDELAWRRPSWPPRRQ